MRAVPTLQKFLQHKANDFFCKQAAKNVAQANDVYTIDKNGLDTRVAFIESAQMAMLPRTL